MNADCSIAPENCIEVGLNININNKNEIDDKKSLYFENGALEV